MEILSLDGLRKAYLEQSITPAKVMDDIRARCEVLADHQIWVYFLSKSEIQPYLDALADKPVESTPLWGIPFAIKDNIDLAGIPTTAGCEAFRYVPQESAPVVHRLIAAGAIPVGKTNLDQFATGLNGTRSPWGACRNAFNKAYIAGGSSSGSAVAVALGLASFSLGTDTAGSGRVPAAFNNLVGLKPSRGLISARGVVPACRSLDCVSIFALNCAEANQVLSKAEGYDPGDPYSRRNVYDNAPRHFGEYEGRLRFGVIPESDLQFFGDGAYAQAYQDTIATLLSGGAELVEIDYAPFAEAARLLYEGPWVAERHLAIGPLLEKNPKALLPVIREIVEPGGQPRATDLFRAQYRLEALKKSCARHLENVDALLTPTAGRLFTVDELLQEPIRRNSELGYYTNFMNLLDLSALALPCALTKSDLPFGVTLAQKAMSDRSLLSIGARLQKWFDLPAGAGQEHLRVVPPAVTHDRRRIDVVVCGAHMQGLPLNWQLSERGGFLSQKTTTASAYRMYALAGGPPFRPGLIRDEAEGKAIEVEVWSLPATEFGSFVSEIPAPLGIGKVELADGSWKSSFICEGYAIHSAKEITHLGGWRRYLSEAQ